jgi:hypothetical protein
MPTFFHYILSIWYNTGDLLLLLCVFVATGESLPSKVGGRRGDSQQGDLTRILLSFQNKECRLKRKLQLNSHFRFNWGSVYLNIKLMKILKWGEFISEITDLWSMKIKIKQRKILGTLNGSSTIYVFYTKCFSLFFLLLFLVVWD